MCFLRPAVEFMAGLAGSFSIAFKTCTVSAPLPVGRDISQKIQLALSIFAH